MKNFPLIRYAVFLGIIENLHETVSAVESNPVIRSERVIDYLTKIRDSDESTRYMYKEYIDAIKSTDTSKEETQISYPSFAEVSYRLITKIVKIVHTNKINRNKTSVDFTDGKKFSAFVCDILANLLEEGELSSKFTEDDNSLLFTTNMLVLDLFNEVDKKESSPVDEIINVAAEEFVKEQELPDYFVDVLKKYAKDNIEDIMNGKEPDPAKYIEEILKEDVFGELSDDCEYGCEDCSDESEDEEILSKIKELFPDATIKVVKIQN